MRTISVGHSPDADDIFMYYAIKFGWVSLPKVKFENIALDIETLNQATLKGTYDICAISFALYPFVKDDFALLKTAVSFGEGYGPKLIKKKGVKLKKNFKVALSGEFTTNALLFKIAYPDARISYMNFLDIEKAVIDGVVDAGVLIHESILTYSNELDVHREIWDIWVDLCEGEALPLPLGGMCLRRSIPLTEAIKYENALIKAVDVANKNRKTLAPMLLEKGLIRVDAKTLDKYLDLYANDNSVKMSEIQYKALNKLFELGYKNGHYQNLIKAEDFLIPSEYEELRAR
ncbi:succinate--CoA ligase [Aliarcobacter cryaerophilus ATCC 43158]|uniref:1,4-dihydroxy-6-naphtoate synthase n=2 Tax=Aliarcobacter cryaerophilus TaxID=28198 RepID=A0AAD0TTY0_9BACT|nr:MqnA/MqnD/SBP family protein [Aliarcobacter cryaerophilus]AYJ79279.1 1,4-dihydroxy-6-naphthoate synthase [Aliarcobacter cryaerophilus ATCC 43158]PRM96131.1 succinate--CoA ligase [Aliarcobacter cryaerophilus]QCZ23544.1 succinate--CoA ligase [Aliarcobacter cryaerophilus ATCC 43158]